MVEDVDGAKEVRDVRGAKVAKEPKETSIHLKLRRVLGLLLRHASFLSAVLYLTGSLAGLLALSSAGRPGGLDEKAFQLSVASPRLGATRAADVMRLYHERKELASEVESENMLEDARAMWNECETQWQPTPGRRHGLAWHRGDGDVVYDVIEATRADGTESLLVVIPYSPVPASARIGMAVGHGLGWHLQEQEWLAKNVVVVYVDVSKSSPKFGLDKSLDMFLSSVVDRRIGRIVQAVVLDFTKGGTEAAWAAPSAALKVHGWNGRLPNLDMLVATRQLAETHFASRERITVHDASTPRDLAWNKARALLRFVCHHGTGIADGGHAALLDRGIDALTVELSFQPTNANLRGALQMAEGLVRGLNNLHERLHHATGLYALGGASVVIDIGMYTACPSLLALACALKAYQLTRARGGAGTTYMTWNQAVRWAVGLVCGAAGLYVNGHVLARYANTAGVGPPLADALKSCAVAFGRIAVFGMSLTEFFAAYDDGKQQGGKNGEESLIRRDATTAWTLCGVSVVLILYRWSLAWMLLTVCLPFILTKAD